MNNSFHIFSKILNRQKNIKHAFFTRNGGVSSSNFDSLNCSFSSKDDLDNVTQNRKRVCDFHQLDLNKLKTVSQIHSSNVIVIKDAKAATKDIKADALITKIPNIILGILTADCAPVLLYDYKDKIAAAIHVGWRGTKNKIINNTVQKMRLIGSNPKNIIGAIGPCIGKDSYEVGEDLYNEFINEDNNLKRFFTSLKSKKFLFNLNDLITYQLIKEKLLMNNISYSNHDTLTEKKLFFSHRRSTKLGSVCGRMISTISIIKNTQ